MTVKVCKVKFSSWSMTCTDNKQQRKVQILPQIIGLALIDLTFVWSALSFPMLFHGNLRKQIERVKTHTHFFHNKNKHTCSVTHAFHLLFFLFVYFNHQFWHAKATSETRETAQIGLICVNRTDVNVGWENKNRKYTITSWWERCVCSQWVSLIWFNDKACQSCIVDCWLIQDC